MQLSKLRTKVLGRNFKHYEKIDSTQEEIYRLLKNKSIIDGTIIMSDIQTAGKGTHGRIWHTDEKQNIAFSFYVETNCKIEQLDRISIEIAEILVDIFKQKYNIELDIKAPNDIIYKDKKIAGILAESKIDNENVKCLIVGIGINTNKMKFSDDIKNIATSIKKEFEIEVDNLEIISEFCNEFEDVIIRRKIR